MKMKGIINYVFRDATTGEITKSREVENHIQKRFERRLVNITNRGGTPINTVLFVSSQNPGRQSSDWETDQIDNARTGVAIPDVPSLTKSYDFAGGEHLIERVVRFNPPTEDKEINLIGLCSSVASGKVQGPDAVVWLNQPATQLTTETLDIFYRVKITDDVNLTYDKDGQDNLNLTQMERWFLIATMLGIQYEYGRILYKAIQNIYSDEVTSYVQVLPGNTVNLRDLSMFRLNREGLRIERVERPQTSKDIINTTFMKMTSNRAYEIGDLIGRAISWIGISDSTAFMQKLPMPNGTPLQNVFGHNASSTKPFYDPLTTQNSLGSVNLNADNWTDDDQFGQFLKIDIKTDGLTGTSQYNFVRNPFFGFSDNSYSPLSLVMPTSSAYNGHVAGFKIARDLRSNSDGFFAEYGNGVSDPWKYKGGFNVLFLWFDEFCIIDVKTGLAVYPAFNHERLFGTETIPRFLPTRISQHYVCTGDEILISCKDTGLYIVNPVLDTLIVADSTTPGLEGTTGCYGCCEGHNGRFYGFFNHPTAPTIYYTDDGGANWVSTGMSDAFLTGDMDRIYGIQADVHAVNGHLAIIHTTNNTEGTDRESTFSWYEVSTNTVTRSNHSFGELIDYYGYNETANHVQNPHRFYYSQLITCSPNQSKWCMARSGSTNVELARPKFFNGFKGAILSQAITTGLETKERRVQWIVDKNGNDAILYLPNDDQNANGAYGTGDVVVVCDGYSVENYYSGLNHNEVTGNLYLDDGIWLGISLRKGNVTSTSNNEDFFNGDLSHYTYLRPIISKDRSWAEDISNTYAAMSCGVYGWNGVSWERGHPGLKATHADAQELFHGVTVAFDDNAGVDQFFASDHYVTTIFDGIVMDGSTSFEYEQTVYLKEVENVIDIESPLLPTETKVSNIFTAKIPVGDIDFVDRESMNTDELAGEIRGTGNGLDDAYSGLIRSAAPVIYGGVVSALPNNCVVPESDYTNALGWVDLTPRMDSNIPFQAYVGLSNITVLGTLADSSTIQYGFHIDSKPNDGGTVGTATITVIESGIPRASADGFLYGTDQRSQLRIILLNSGKMSYQYKTSDGPNWITLFESPSLGMVTLENLYLDILMVPRSNRGFELVSFNYLDANSNDYYFYIGNGVDNGLFDPEFSVVDPANSKVIIDGQEAVNLANNDADSVLAANQISIFYNDGVVRYSAQDAGKSVTGKFLVVKQ